jgi:hypothetical protein
MIFAQRREVRTFRILRAGVEVRVYEDAVLLDAVLESISKDTNRVSAGLQKLTTRQESQGKCGRDA